MTDGQTFFFLLLAFYFWECIAWVRPGAISYTRFFKSWHSNKPLEFLYKQGVSIFWNPLPSYFFPQHIGQEMPFELTEEYLILKPQQTKIPWDALKLKQDRSLLYLAADLSIKGRNPIWAQAVKEALNAVASVTADKRKSAIAYFYQRSFSHTHTKRLIKRAHTITSTIRLNEFLIMGLFFGLIPYIYRYKIDEISILLTASLYCVFLIFNAVLVFFATKKFYPNSEKGYRWSMAFSALFPWNAMRSGQHLLNDALSLQHPLAISAALMSPQGLQNDTSTYWRKVHFLKNETLAPMQREAFEHFLVENSIQRSELLAPPVQDGSNTTHYCPCCHAQYQRAAGSCIECPEVKLTSF